MCDEIPGYLVAKRTEALPLHEAFYAHAGQEARRRAEKNQQSRQSRQSSTRSGPRTRSRY
jgi:hypothetical protein